ncbi:MAG: hypothetical protein F6K41_01920 [Symploca sp. SIO3E6]|nr:hypothetical protein [Caldora sp. SIO3E6]
MGYIVDPPKSPLTRGTLNWGGKLTSFPSCLLPPAFCLLPPAFCLLPPAS